MFECEGQMNIFDFIEPDQKVTPEWTCSFTTPVIDNGKPAFKTQDGKVVNLGDNKPICNFSGHICNKKSIWEVADTLDDKPKCPHICCRQCDVQGCGARCNGSIQPKLKFCWDDDINEILDRLNELALKYGLSLDEPKWEIWSHVPNLGYRMTANLNVRKSDLSDALFDDLDIIKTFAKTRQVDFSAFNPFFFGNDGVAYFHISTMFLDKARQKIK